MMNIIIMGVGENLKDCLSIYSKYLEECNVLEIWDNDEKKVGSKIVIKKNTYTVKKPCKPSKETIILVSSIKFFEEIKRGLLLDKELEINESQINKFCYLKNEITRSIINKYKNSADTEVERIVEYLKSGGELDVYMNNTKMKEAWHKADFDIKRDESTGLLFSYWKGNKLYLKRSLNTKESAMEYLRNIYSEQIRESPHCYKKEGFSIKRSDVVVDAGAAEGFFSLESVKIAKKIIIVESDLEWIEALKCTFEQFKDKVTIIDKKLCGYCNDECVSIDALDSKENPISYIKMDIEGSEREVLKEASILSENRSIKVIACTYHYKNDQYIIEKILKENGFRTRFSDGYMYFNYYEGIHVDDLRKALCFAVKERS